MNQKTTLARRVLVAQEPFAALDEGRVLWHRGKWPVRWLALPGATPCVAGFRLPLQCEEASTLRVHITAGERYRLFVDGQLVGVGPERGDERHWRIDSWDLSLGVGEHWLAAEVWALGTQSAVWQAAVAPGFLLAVEGPWMERLSTGQAPWQVRRLDAYQFDAATAGQTMTGPRAIVDGRQMPWGWTVGAGEGFVPATPGAAANGNRSITDRAFPSLVPAGMSPVSMKPLPNGRAVFVEQFVGLDASPMLDPAQQRVDELPAWQDWLDGRGSITIAAGTAWRCLVDLGVYRAAWPQVHARGEGGTIRLRFSEGLYEPKETQGKWSRSKGDRRQWQHRESCGLGPTFLTAGGEGQAYRALEWECGRWLEVIALAGTQPLVIDALELADTSFPLAEEGEVEADDTRLAFLRSMCLHTLRVGTHSHYCDCPYYERLQYIGDTRLEALTTYQFSSDSRLQRRALCDFAGARLPDGQLPSRHPARGVQLIPPFSLWWVHMLHDYAWWRDDPGLVRELLPTARGILDAWWSWRNGDGLVQKPPGWNFVDWVPTWSFGMPLDADKGVSAVLNWHAAWTACVVADLERHFGEPELESMQRRRAAALAQSLDAAWDSSRQRYSDDLAHTAASEHVQCLALLSGLLSPARRNAVAASLCNDSDLARTTIYFTHYLFEAYRLLRRIDLFWQRMGLWFELPAVGLTTTPEMPEPTRSDCHPWGTHPVYHIAATLAGIRPGKPGFASVQVDPQPGPLRQLRVVVPHPRGRIVFDWQQGHVPSLTAPVPASFAALTTPDTDITPIR